MRTQELENKVLQIVEAVVRGEQIEDSRIELKAEWPDAKKAARRLAGHANAARSDWILWIVGLDEKGRCVKPAREEELTEWWAQVAAEFEGVRLEPQVLSVAVAGGTVVALRCATDRAPYVVRNPDGGAIQFEVPWRDANAVRSATRSNLIALLVPLSLAPSIEHLAGSVRVTRADGPQGSATARGDVDIRLQLYVTPRKSERVVFPFHRCRVQVRIEGADLADLDYVGINPDFGYTKSGIGGKRVSHSPNAEVSASEVILDGPTRLSLTARSREPIRTFDVGAQSVTVVFSIQAVDMTRQSFSLTLGLAGAQQGDYLEFSAPLSATGFETIS